MTRSAPPSTYDDDFFAWTQEQAAAIRELPAALVRDRLDVENLAGEIEDLGKRDLREIRSFLRRLFEHLVKIGSCPASQAVRDWRAEARAFHRSVMNAYAPSMRQLLDVADIWRASAKPAREDLDEMGVRSSAPAECPFTLDEILSDSFELDAALAKLDGTAPV